MYGVWIWIFMEILKFLPTVPTNGCKNYRITQFKVNLINLRISPYIIPCVYPLFVVFFTYSVSKIFV